MRIILKLWFFLYNRIKGFPRTSVIDPRSKHVMLKCEGYNRIGKNSTTCYVKLGYASFIGTDANAESVEIGKYCSIAARLNIVSGQHPSKTFVSSHPAFYSLVKQGGMSYVDRQKFKENKFADPDKQIKVIIGNDVWLGNSVTILEGVTIGDGAIVATGSVVIKNVEPYEVVGGVPAKHIRYRFEEEQRLFLNELKWWDKDIDWIQENADQFEDIETFMKNIKLT